MLEEEGVSGEGDSQLLEVTKGEGGVLCVSYSQSIYYELSNGRIPFVIC